jgi:glycosyltransferase involved in cell wall biosynthesis
VLCYDTEPTGLRKALAAWTWVDGSLGDSFPLVFVSDETAPQDRVSEAAAAFDVADSVRVRSPGRDHPHLFREAAALLSVRPSAWGQPYRWALANGVPVAAFDTGAAGSIVGEAGYLVSDGSTRTLGAACLSVLVQDDLAESLRSKGLRRAESYLDTPPVEWIGGLIESSRTGRSAHPARG